LWDRGRPARNATREAPCDEVIIYGPPCPWANARDRIDRVSSMVKNAQL